MNLIDAIQNYEYAQNMMQDATEKIEELIENGYKPTQEEFDYFYWKTDLKSTIITPGVTRKNAEMIPSPTTVTCVCIDCNNENEVVVNSRSKKAEMIRNKTNVCESCQQIRDNVKDTCAKKRYLLFEERENEIKKLKLMPYREYLKTEHWMKKRLQTLKRYNFRCQMCNRKDKLHVHHRTYERRGEELLTDLICLCDKCHAKFHDKIKEE